MTDSDQIHDSSEDDPSGSTSCDETAETARADAERPVVATAVTPKLTWTSAPPGDDSAPDHDGDGGAGYSLADEATVEHSARVLRHND